MNETRIVEQVNKCAVCDGMDKQVAQYYVSILACFEPLCVVSLRD